MDDFDRHLEQELSRVLDPIVFTPAPRRAGGWREGRRGRGFRALIGGLPDGGPTPILAPETVAVVPVPASIGAPYSAG